MQAALEVTERKVVDDCVDESLLEHTDSPCALSHLGLVSSLHYRVSQCVGAALSPGTRPAPA